MAVKTFVGFDVGETLIAYEGLALDWSAHYEPALRHALNETPPEAEVVVAREILTFYNTRRNPRVFEIAPGEVTDKLARLFGVDPAPFTRAFFGYFQRRASPMDGAAEALAALQARGAFLAALSDVPYGMPTSLLHEDLGELAPAFDRIVSSCDVGVRKPHGRGLRTLLTASGRAPGDGWYVGNEPKDIQVARDAGLRSVLLCAAPDPPDHGQTHTIRHLREIPELVG